MEAILNKPTISLDYLAHKTKEALAEIFSHGTKLLADDDGQDYVVMPSAEYVKLIDELADAELERLAAERLAKGIREEDCIPAEQVYAELGITEKDLEGWEDVEIE